MDSRVLKQHLARTPILCGVPGEVLDPLAESAFAREYHRGQALWSAGDAPLGLAVISKGLVKLMRRSPSGQAMLCACLGAPQSVGDAVLVRGLPYPADAVVATPHASVIVVPRELFLSAMQACPQIATAMCENLRVKLSALHDKIDVLSAGSVEARLATILLKLSDQYGDDLEDGTHLLPVALSRRELAEWVSTSLETVVRIMKRWERAGAVETTPHGFLIRSFDELRAAAA